MNKQDIYAVVLAGGKGTRLNCVDRPKVLHEVAGRPMICYVIDAVKKVTKNIVVITGFCGEKIEEELKNEGVQFAHQVEQLGTAHAAAQASQLLKDKDGIILIVNGDHPLLDEGTLRQMADAMRDGLTLAIASAVENNHVSFGRVLRDENSKVIGVVEAKDATPEQLDIKEKNIGFYAAQSKWLWGALKRISKSKVTGEYYITDLVDIAIKDGEPVEAVQIKNLNAIKGINTPEELREVEGIISRG